MNTTETNGAEVKSGVGIVNIILILLCIVVGALAFRSYSQAAALKQNPVAIDAAKIQEIVNKVEKLIDLPKNELPTIATVSDLSKLKDQPFFAHAKVGDQILLYAATRQAYLYDPSANMVIEVASLNIGR